MGSGARSGVEREDEEDEADDGRNEGLPCCRWATSIILATVGDPMTKSGSLSDVEIILQVQCRQTRKMGENRKEKG